MAPSGEGHAVAFQEFVRTLGNEAAAIRWVTWAERRQLLVRGADARCPGCGARSWLPMAALPPPVPCPGCGRQIDQPYGPRGLTFTYRLGEPLRRVLESDSLGHVLALSWFAELLDRGNLVGAHPGVTFVDPADAGRTLGEADVLLLFGDGCLVPIEVKRRAAGVDERTLQLMDTLSDTLDAPWDGLVVTEPARDIPSVAAAARRAPDRPRVVVTDDQLQADRVLWSMGEDPFAWNPRTAGEDGEREAAFARRLAEDDPDRSPDLLRHALLDSSL